MTDKELENRLGELVKSERRISIEILDLIREAEKRKIYLERAYPSLFEWLVGAYGYSQPAAYRRIQASRLLGAVPEAKEKLATGELNVSVMARVQSRIQVEERKTREKISVETKRTVLKAVEGKSVDEAEIEIHREFPSPPGKLSSLRVVGAEHSRLTVVLEEEAVVKLKRVKELISHSCQTWAEVVAYLANDYVKRKDPLLRS